jgi:asparagine synthetase B (glutamine-hydrolysing)
MPHDIRASVLLYETASKHGYRLHLSGHGVDEIMSDYRGSKISNFGGKFPEQLEKIFPTAPSDIKAVWNNFYNNINAGNIRREEFICSLFGIETRYPFLDKYVVQEFLNLDIKLKLRFYKAPIKEYLEKNKYPFDVGRKAGLYA